MELCKKLYLVAALLTGSGGARGGTWGTSRLTTGWPLCSPSDSTPVESPPVTTVDSVVRSACELKGWVLQLAKVSLDSVDSTLFISTLLPEVPGPPAEVRTPRMLPSLGLAAALKLSDGERPRERSISGSSSSPAAPASDFKLLSLEWLFERLLQGRNKTDKTVQSCMVGMVRRREREKEKGEEGGKESERWVWVKSTVVWNKQNYYHASWKSTRCSETEKWSQTEITWSKSEESECLYCTTKSGGGTFRHSTCPKIIAITSVSSKTELASSCQYCLHYFETMSSTESSR